MLTKNKINPTRGNNNNNNKDLHLKQTYTTKYKPKSRKKNITLSILLTRSHKKG